LSEGEGFPFLAVSNSVDLSVWLGSEVSSMPRFQGNSFVLVFLLEGFPFLAMSNSVDLVRGSWFDSEVSSVGRLEGNSSVGLNFLSEVFPFLGVSNRVDLAIGLNSHILVVISLDFDLVRSLEGFPFLAVSNGVNVVLRSRVDSNVGVMPASKGDSSVVLFNGEGLPFLAVSNGVDVGLRSRVHSKVSSMIRSNSNSSILLGNKGPGFPFLAVIDNIEFSVRLASNVGSVISLQRDWHCYVRKKRCEGDDTRAN